MKLPLIVVGCGLALCSGALAGWALSDDRTGRFGFDPVEVYKVSDRSQRLCLADFNHDGRTDIACINNEESRIDLFLQRDPAAPASETAAEAKSGVSGGPATNEFDDPARYEKQEISTTRSVISLIAWDADRDGRTDLVYSTQGDQLVIRYQGTETWSEQYELRLPDLAEDALGLSLIDLGADGIPQLLVVGTKVLYFVTHDPDDRKAKYDSIPVTSENASLLQVGDLNRDGRDDVAYVVSDDQTPIAIRLQTPEGTLGPETRFRTTRPMAVTIGDADGIPGAEILTIDQRTRRLAIQQVAMPDVDPEVLAARLVRYGLGATAGTRERSMVFADVNADDRTDVLVTDGANAQVQAFLQTDTGLAAPVPCPSFSDVTQIAAADLNRDGSDDVLVLSSKEKTLGACEWTDGILSFPQALPCQGEPQFFQVHTGIDGRPIVLVLESADARNTGTLRSYHKSELGEWQTDPSSLTLKLESTPRALFTVNANADGHLDLLIAYATGRAPTLLLGEAGAKRFTQVESTAGIKLNEFDPARVFVDPRDPTVLLSTQDRFVRQLQLEGTGGTWQVASQRNSVGNASKLTGVARLDLNADGASEFAFVDAGLGKIQFFAEDPTAAMLTEVDFGTGGVAQLGVSDLNHDGRDDLVLLSGQQLAIAFTDRPSDRLQELGSYDVPRQKVSMTDVVIGDLDADSRPDLAVTDTVGERIDLMTVSEGTPKHAVEWRIFEQKGFRNSDENSFEPREAAIGDVTGDGLNDLVLLIHDRILVYPQQAWVAAP